MNKNDVIVLLEEAAAVCENNAKVYKEEAEALPHGPGSLAEFLKLNNECFYAEENAFAYRRAINYLDAHLKDV